MTGARLIAHSQGGNTDGLVTSSLEASLLVNHTAKVGESVE